MAGLLNPQELAPEAYQALMDEVARRKVAALVASFEATPDPGRVRVWKHNARTWEQVSVLSLVPTPRLLPEISPKTAPRLLHLVSEVC